MTKELKESLKTIKPDTYRQAKSDPANKKVKEDVKNANKGVNKLRRFIDKSNAKAKK